VDKPHHGRATIPIAPITALVLPARPGSLHLQVQIADDC
jgi:hypothetical protein